MRRHTAQASSTRLRGEAGTRLAQQRPWEAGLSTLILWCGLGRSRILPRAPDADANSLPQLDAGRTSSPPYPQPQRLHKATPTEHSRVRS